MNNLFHINKHQLDAFGSCDACFIRMRVTDNNYEPEPDKVALMIDLSFHQWKWGKGSRPNRLGLPYGQTMHFVKIRKCREFKLKIDQLLLISEFATYELDSIYYC